MITYKELYEKFEEKGYCLYNYWIPVPPIFDPSVFNLLNKTREEAFNDFKKTFKSEFDALEDRLDYLNTWIDYQQYKF